ncbi:hypothetical protein [Streptomyces sp. NPDC058572]|uniref:hypothetical protein n=1 Tax=Streptomyces sp. NPDC058572 TaxID=3346546 RepID=UPI003657212D
MSQHQTAGTNARLRLFALLVAQGVPASEADDLEAGAVAGAQSEVVELGGIAPASRGSLFSDGWDDGRERGLGGHRGPGLVAARRPVGRGR